jgi:hypothetical protein
MRVLYEPAHTCLFRPSEFNKYAVTELVYTIFFFSPSTSDVSGVSSAYSRIPLRKWYEQFNQLLTCARIINTMQPSARR